MRITIKVTKEVLEASKYCGLSKEPANKNCAIALAIRDVFPKMLVGTMFLSETMPINCGIPMPKIAQEFIELFDSTPPSERVKMEPISFEIEVPEYLVNEIGISEITEIVNKSKTLELVESINL